MEIVYLAQNTPVSKLTKVANDHIIPELTDSYPSDLTNESIGSRKKSGPMSIGSYLVGALSEGVKQNFLGSNINLEFLVLSIRVYFIQLSTFAVSNQKKLKPDTYSETTYSLSKKAVRPVFN